MKLEKISQQIEISGIHRKQIYSNEKFETLLVSVEAGVKVPPQSAPADACLYLMEGHIILEIDDISTDLLADDFFSFREGQMHGLKAVRNSKFIISRNRFE